MLFLLLFELSILFGFLLDLVLADPEKLPHPVVIIGRGISLLEKNLRQIFPDTPGGRRAGGAVMAVLIPVTTFVVTAGLCVLAWIIHPVVFFLLHTLWCWQAPAIRGLANEAQNVYRCLTDRGAGSGSGAGSSAGGSGMDDASDPEQDTTAGSGNGSGSSAGGAGMDAASDSNRDPAWRCAARKAVSRIVGRDTRALDAAGVTRAAVETVAENFSDGVIAPYFYMMIGGAPLALTYKSINTMDSMVGYKNETYIDFGRVPAHLDDVAGYIPARLGALLWICAAAMTKPVKAKMFAGASSGADAAMTGADAATTGADAAMTGADAAMTGADTAMIGADAAMTGPANDFDPTACNARGAWRIWRRDNRNHASPNSAQTESACAGALGVQLAGPAYYFGEFYDKPTIGDALRPIEPEDILRTNRMMYAASLLSVLLAMAVSTGLLTALP